MRVIICGGRYYSDRDNVFRTLSRIHENIIEITEVFHGDAGKTIEGKAVEGADRIAGEWAIENSISVNVFQAVWKYYGKSAGSLRNQTMLDVGRIAAVIAFPGGTGTGDMKARARRMGVLVIEVDDDGNTYSETTQSTRLLVNREGPTEV